MKKLNHNRILNIVAALLFAVSLMCGSALQVRAYTADTSMTGYPLIREDMYFEDSTSLYYGVLGTDDIYYFTMPDNYISPLTNYIRFGGNNSNFVYPYNNLYDYYIVGTYAFEVNNFNNYSFNPYGIQMVVYSYDGQEHLYELDNVEYYEYANKYYLGNSFSAKLPNDLSSVGYFNFYGDDFVTFCGDIIFSASIVPVAKGTEAEQLNQAILNELVKINQNLVTANTLQQQTIDAIKDHDTNVGNWFNTLTSNLGSWFQQLYTSMGVGFEKLYQQMTKEQDEQLHGYQDTTTSEAANAFSSESDKLTALEGDLSNQSNQYVSDFTAEGFDLGILATIGSSMVFVTTWFTNFWNMGGIWTAGLNFCFALSIVFFILRFKR